MGLDYAPLDLASFSLEAYNFETIATPNLRLYSAVYPFVALDPSNPLSWIYINGGVDDLLGKNQLDFFLGAGLRFQDNDLKGIAGFVPRP